MKTDVSKSDEARLIASLKALSSYENLEEVLDIEPVLRYFAVHNFLLPQGAEGTQGLYAGLKFRIGAEFGGVLLYMARNQRVCVIDNLSRIHCSRCSAILPSITLSLTATATPEV